jgi:hypothetical protein
MSLFGIFLINDYLGQLLQFIVDYFVIFINELQLLLAYVYMCQSYIIILSSVTSVCGTVLHPFTNLIRKSCLFLAHIFKNVTDAPWN